MQKSILRKLAIPFAGIIVGLGLVAAAPASAEAGQSRFAIGIYSSNGHVVIGSGRGHGPRYRDHRSHRPRGCHPRRAIRKAERHGARHARIVRIGDRFIKVKGYKRGRQIKIGFHRHSRHCDVAWIKRGRHRHENRRGRGVDHGYNRSHSYYRW